MVGKHYRHLLYQYPMQMFLGFCHALLPSKHWGGLSDVISQPPKLKFLLGHHLATNSFGLARLFLSSSCHLQNFRHHGNQNGCNLQGRKPKECQCGETTVVVGVVNGLLSFLVTLLWFYLCHITQKPNERKKNCSKNESKP